MPKPPKKHTDHVRPDEYRLDPSKLLDPKYETYGRVVAREAAQPVKDAYAHLRGIAPKPGHAPYYFNPKLKPGEKKSDYETYGAALGKAVAKPFVDAGKRVAHEDYSRPEYANVPSTFSKVINAIKSFFSAIYSAIGRFFKKLFGLTSGNPTSVSHAAVPPVVPPSAPPAVSPSTPTAGPKPPAPPSGPGVNPLDSTSSIPVVPASGPSAPPPPPLGIPSGQAAPQPSFVPPAPPPPPLGVAPAGRPGGKTLVPPSFVPPAPISVAPADQDTSSSASVPVVSAAQPIGPSVPPAPPPPPPLGVTPAGQSSSSVPVVSTSRPSGQTPVPPSLVVPGPVGVTTTDQAGSASVTSQPPVSPVVADTDVPADRPSDPSGQTAVPASFIPPEIVITPPESSPSTKPETPVSPVSPASSFHSMTSSVTAASAASSTGSPSGLVVTAFAQANPSPATDEVIKGGYKRTVNDDGKVHWCRLVHKI